MKLRSYLVVLILAAVVPILLFSTALIVFHQREEQADIERRLQETVRAMSASVDRELEMSITTLETLATAQSLDTGDVRGFYARAKRVVSAHPDWSALALHDAAGRRMFTTAEPLGEASSPQGESNPPFRDAMATRSPVVSDLLEPDKVVAIDVPVVRGDRLAWVLAVTIRPERLAALLVRQIPSNWVATIIDRNKIVIARTPGFERYIGHPTLPRVASETSRADEASYRTVSMDGEAVHVAHTRSRLSGWTVATAIPVASLESPIERMLVVVGGQGLLLGLLSIVLATLVARRLGGPIRALRVAAGALGRGMPLPRAEPTVIHEMNELRAAIEDAGVVLERDAARARAQHGVSQALAAARDQDAGITGSLRAVCEALNWDRAELWIADTPGNELRVAGHWRLPWAPLAAGGSATVSSGTASAALAHDVWASAEPRWMRERDGMVGDDALRDAIGVPIGGRGAVLAVLIFRARHIGEPDGALLRMLANIAGHIGQFLQRQWAERERAEMLAREQVARAEAENANRVKDEFLATLSHELRTPLQSMLGWVQVLRSGRASSETASRALETIERNTRMQAELIDDLLDISRIAAGKLRIAVRPIDLVPVIEAAVEAVRSAADAKGIRLDVALGAIVGVSGDPDRLQQVVWNLLANGVKFTPRGGRVEVRLDRTEENARITVRDTGQGIHADFLPHIFERFRQADSTTTRRHPGLGLGLSIVRHLVELHGGVVRADSGGEGCGTTFTVELPLIVVPAVSAVAQPATVRGPEGKPVLAGVRVLVVDDDASTCELLRTVLAGEGAVVTTAGSAGEAVAALKRTLPDVLLSDISMPGEDGYALIDRVRALDAAHGGLTPAAALTAYARGEDRRRALAAGFQMHLAKPMAPTDLVEVVAKLAAGRAKGLTGSGQPATTT